jgi:serine/threonine-protein kinase
MQRVKHPNVVQLLESHYDTDKRIHFMIMEFAEGRSLAQVLELGGALPQHKLTKIMKAIAEALQAMHEQNIMHLDVKPQNIMYQEEDDSKLKLADFGLAQAIAFSSWYTGDNARLDDMTMMITQHQGIAGTPLYMPMEQLDAGKVLDARSDVYALGITIYHSSAVGAFRIIPPAPRAWT